MTDHWGGGSGVVYRPPVKPKKLTEKQRFMRWYERACKQSLAVQYGSYAAMQEAWLASARAKR